MNRRVFVVGLVGIWTGTARSVRVFAQSTPTVTTTDVAFESEAAALGAAVWARDIDPQTNAPTRRATGFITNDRAIHLVIPVIRIQAKTLVAAEWSFNGTVIEALQTELTVAQGYTDGWLAFTITRADADIWPIGAYAVEVLVNGASALVEEIAVTVPRIT